METLAGAPVLHTDETSLYGVSLVLERAEGLWIWCRGEEEPYLDLVQGYSTTPLGHCHPVVVESIRRHAARLDTVHSLVTVEALALGAALASHSGMPDARAHFSVGGAEAVGIALRIARQVTKRSVVACLRGSFHGLNADTLPLSRGFVTLDSNLLGETIELTIGDSNAIQMIEHHRPAALIFEPVQAAAGWRTLPQQWVRDLAQACGATGTLIVVDEIQCGLGRCGDLVAVSRFDITPDIMLFGKALAGGVWPLGAILVAAKVAEGLPGRGFGIGSTFSNNALGSAVAHDVLDHIVTQRLWEKARELGDVFLSAASELKAPGLRGVRAEGLGLALDFTSSSAAARFVDTCLRNHILSYAAGVTRDVIKLSPPLCSTPAEMAYIAGRLAAVAQQCSTGGLDA